MDSTGAGTRACKSYSFAFQDVTVTLINTPGIIGTGGVEVNKQHLENILEFVSSIKSIDAICILLKPNEDRLDSILRYCFLDLLSQLDRSAARNIIFLFTHSRSIQYRLGSMGTSIKKIMETIKETKPDLDFEFFTENCFLFDSEAFKFVVAKDKIGDKSNSGKLE